MPVKIDWLNIDVRDGEITAAESFKIREEIPSIPDALLGPKSWSSFKTSFSEIS
jgi:hypothetical protein